MKEELTDLIQEDVEICEEFPAFAEDYSEILKYFELDHQLVDYYLQVGEIKQTQGWIIHLSVVISEAMDLFKTIIPYLLYEKVPFKIPMDKETLSNLVHASLGIPKIGKVICIYPENDERALYLAKELINLTVNHRGPRILTDVCLGNIVYTRYGSFLPEYSNGQARDEYCIYDKEGRLTKNTYTIPFEISNWLSWPFGEITSEKVPDIKKTLKHIYKPLTVLKYDTKGSVFKGIYLKNIFRTAECVIKQGSMNMSCEENGRTIHDRLVWQQELYCKLADVIPMPKVFDLFQENGDTYLAMEYISGNSLYDRRIQINSKSKCWFHLQPSESIPLINYLIKIAKIIETLHQKGYVHRDIAPGNFLIDKKDNIYLIDMELVYSYKDQKPTPPFQFGTAGFMSPDQKKTNQPTIKDDIYSFGALMISTFTGLSPVKFCADKSDILFKNLLVFIRNNEIAKLICSCLDYDPENRPSLREIQSKLEKYGEELLLENDLIEINSRTLNPDTKGAKETIQAALNGLNKPPIPLSNDMWYSKSEKTGNFKTFLNKEYSRYIGLHTGIGGVLYVLSRAKRIGFSIDACKNEYTSSLEYVLHQCSESSSGYNPGLYNGTAGVAVTLMGAIKAGLRENTDANRLKIQEWLSASNTELNLTNGLTGQAIAILQCQEYLDANTVNKLLSPIIDQLLATQQKDGSWLFPDPLEKKGRQNMSFGFGISGIIWLLLEYTLLSKNTQSAEASLKGLHWLLKKTNNLQAIFPATSNQGNQAEIYKFGDERKTILLTFVKAYETLQDNIYKKVVEDVLTTYPACIIRNDFSQTIGLAGLGEIYLEAFKVFKNSEWQQRADWITNVYINTFFKTSDDTGYWKMDDNNDPTADFMVGMSGIIHFLLRWIAPDKLGYRFLK